MPFEEIEGRGWLERRHNFAITNLPWSDASERLKQAIRCELHLRDLREHSWPPRPATKTEAYAVRFAAKPSAARLAVVTEYARAFNVRHRSKLLAEAEAADLGAAE